MKKIRRILTLCIVFLMVMQIALPTLSQAIDIVKLNVKSPRLYTAIQNANSITLNIQENRPGTNNKYGVTRKDNGTGILQKIFKIGELQNNVLIFDSAYYCLRGGLGFGSSETEISNDGVEYRKLADLESKEDIQDYFKGLNNNIGLSDENYNSICWIVDNMYLPKHEKAEKMKTELFEKVQKYVDEKKVKMYANNDFSKNNIKLTDDDIEVVQQMALWYFTNIDEQNTDKKDKSVSIAYGENFTLSTYLKLNENNITDQNRAEQVDVLYRYFIDNAKANNGYKGASIVEPELKLENLEPTIEVKQVGLSDKYVVGPFKITEKGNIDYNFTSTLKYKTTSEDADWTTLTIGNGEMTAPYLSDADGNEIEGTKNVKDMIRKRKWRVLYCNI